MPLDELDGPDKAGEYLCARGGECNNAKASSDPSVVALVDRFGQSVQGSKPNAMKRKAAKNR